jgi:hypothetical protein
MSEPGDINFDDLKPDEFEQYLPELFASSEKVSQDPRLQKLFAAHPDCLALVRDLETIAETARSLFEPEDDPSDKVWANIQTKLRDGSALDSDDEEDGGLPDGLAEPN